MGQSAQLNSPPPPKHHSYWAGVGVGVDRSLVRVPPGTRPMLKTNLPALAGWLGTPLVFCGTPKMTTSYEG
jgi:hypothetical protein